MAISMPNSTAKTAARRAASEARGGLVINYAYLWARRAEQGHDEAEKNRPCAIVLGTIAVNDSTRVMVLPITHSPPDPSDSEIEIPPATRKRLGLDEAPCWVMISELNRFIWPGPDLRPIPGSTDRFAYGLLPPRFFRAVRDSLIRRLKQGQVKATSRS
jgi:hypothetical protein